MTHNLLHKNLQILVTGGAGFIGSNTINYLLDQNYKVSCLDNFSVGKMENLSVAIEHKNFTLIKGDIRKYEDCQKAVKGIDVILHLAAIGSVPRSIKHPLMYTRVNVDGFVNMLVAAKKEGIKRIVYASSSSVYGDSISIPKSEENIGNPLSPYAVTKQVNELYAAVFAKTYNMECIGFRYFNVFGKNQDPNGSYAAVIPFWIKQFLNHKNPVINGDGSYTRDFTYIDNVVQANVNAMLIPAITIKDRQIKYGNQKHPDNQPNSYISEVFNIANGESTNLNQLFESLRIELAKQDSKISNIKPEFGPFRKGDIPHSQALIQKARFILDYDPIVTARRGFELVSEWYCNNNKIFRNEN